MTEVAGLPAHVLLVHAVIVLVPLAALAVVLGALWPAGRRRLGLLTPALAVVAAVLVPVTANAGEWLLPRVGGPPLAIVHAELGRTLWRWTTALALVALMQYLWHRHQARRPEGSGGPRVVAGVLLVAALGVSIGTTVRTVQVGDSGSRSVWEEAYRSD